MPRKDLHKEPFDESTIAKLEMFEDYAQEWIPTFVMSDYSSIQIFDFFAGTGYDKNGIPGSPIRILNKIKEQIGHIFQRKVKVRLYLNEFDKEKYDQLKDACKCYLQENTDVERAIEISYLNEDFDAVFNKLLPRIKESPALVYLDQNGIKFLSEKYFSELEKTRQTDFLYFVSSSYFWRFGDKESFKIHLDIDMTKAKENPYKFIHRSIIEQIRQRLPRNTGLKLYPFSLKKGANIHGIIFGASHTRAVDKFLRIAWKRSPINGDANFDIDDDELKRQGLLFDNPTLTKIESFQRKVTEKVLNGEVSNNKELFDYTLSEGHIGEHAAEVLKEMKKRSEIDYDGRSPLVTYENVYSKRKRIVTYRIPK